MLTSFSVHVRGRLVVRTRPKFTELALSLDARKCERCGELTYWKKPRQSTRGYCAEHAYADGPEYSEALTTLVRTLRPERVEPFEPEHFLPGGYGDGLVLLVVRGRWIVGGFPYRFTVLVAPQDAGPCARCGGRIRLYGVNGYPLCTDCEER